jgi:hypothetical protein
MKVLSFGGKCSSWEAVICSEYESAGDLLPKGRSSLGECIYRSMAFCSGRYWMHAEDHGASDSRRKRRAPDLEHFGSELTVVYCEFFFSAHSLFAA